MVRLSPQDKSLPRFTRLVIVMGDGHEIMRISWLPPAMIPKGRVRAFSDKHNGSSRNPAEPRARRIASIFGSDDLRLRRLGFALESSVNWGPGSRAEMRQRKGGYLEVCGKEFPCSTVGWMPVRALSLDLPPHAG